MGNRTLRRLLRLLRQEGVSHFKTADLEVSIDLNHRAPAAAKGSDGLLTQDVGNVPFTSDEPTDPLETLFFHEKAPS